MPGVATSPGRLRPPTACHCRPCHPLPHLNLSSPPRQPTDSYDLKGLRQQLEKGGYSCTEFPEVLYSRCEPWLMRLGLCWRGPVLPLPDLPLGRSLLRVAGSLACHFDPGKWKLGLDLG